MFRKIGAVIAYLPILVVVFLKIFTLFSSVNLLSNAFGNSGTCTEIYSSKIYIWDGIVNCLLKQLNAWLGCILYNGNIKHFTNIQVTHYWSYNISCTSDEKLWQSSRSHALVSSISSTGSVCLNMSIMSFSLPSLTVWKMSLAAVRLGVIFYIFHFGDAKSQQSCDSRQFIDRIGPISYSITRIILFTRIKVPSPCNSHASCNTWVAHNVTAACVWLALLGQRFSLGNSVGGDEGHKFGRTSEVTVTWSFSCIGVSVRMQWDHHARW